MSNLGLNRIATLAALLAVSEPEVLFPYREPQDPRSSANRKSRLDALEQSVRDDDARRVAAETKRKRRMERNQRVQS